jgi:NDP-sugar pyrophosphorylase family protein
MDQAFILGAGLGTRLRPLTHLLPKPLVPVFHRPMAAYAFDACIAAGIHRFAVNTHHLAECWGGFGAPTGAEVDFFHEPILLETGGGLKNIEPWMGGKPLLVHNGDILTTLPLEKLIAAHEASGNLATLAVRRHGPPPHIALDAGGTRVADIRRMLGVADGTHGFTGIYCVNPELLARIPGGEIVSVIPAFLECARQGKLGAVVIEEGLWLDLGDRESYLQAHRGLELAPKIHHAAEIHATAAVENSVVGPGARVEAGARLVGCVVWPGAVVRAGADLADCIVATSADGCHRGADFA